MRRLIAVESAMSDKVAAWDREQARIGDPAAANVEAKKKLLRIAVGMEHDLEVIFESIERTLGGYLQDHYHGERMIASRAKKILEELEIEKQVSTQSSTTEDRMLNELSPLSVLREATKAVPAVKWALGVGGLLAAVALVYVFKLDPRAAFVGILALLCFMGVLVIFARVAAQRSSAFAAPAMVFTWFALIMFMVTTTSLFTSVFFSRPLDLQGWLTGKATAEPAPPSPSKIVREVIEGNKVTVGTGGSYEGGRNPCPGANRQQQSCVRPQHGGVLVEKSGKPRIYSQNGRTNTQNETESPQEYCVFFHSATGACEIEDVITGAASAVEEYTVRQ